MRSRLDRGVGSKDWIELFPASRVWNLPPIHGDHVPILLGVLKQPGRQPVQGARRFRFDAHWVQNASSSEAVKVGWDSRVVGYPMFRVVHKIRETRYSLNAWQRATFGNRGREIEALRGRLQALLSLPLTDEFQLEQSILSGKLDSLLNEEHAYWKQRAKVNWLKDGDRNTRYFHRKSSNRKTKNRLQGLFDVNGV